MSDRSNECVLVARVSTSFLCLNNFDDSPMACSCACCWAVWLSRTREVDMSKWSTLEIIRQIVCLTSRRGLCIFRILRPIYPKLVIVTSQYGSRFRVFCLLYLLATLTHCLSALGAHFTQARALIAGKLMLVRSVDAELDRKIFHSMTLKTRLKPGVISYSRNETENKKIVEINF